MHTSVWTASAAAIFLLTLSINAGDILRGGAPANRPRNYGVNAATSAAADLARRNASDALARTSKAVQAVQQLQLQARQRFVGINNLGMNPNNPGSPLPIVQDGLRPGGLQIIGAPTGADAPTESSVNGHVNVTIRQRVQQAFLDWQTFNVGRNTSVIFDQSLGGKSVGQWIAFNTIKDPSGAPSQIMGQIKAPGQVYLINQNGIIFGGTSQINTHALVASSLPINPNLVERGLLNNPDVQHLFSALPIAAGAKGTPGFTPELNADKKIGDIIVQRGARLTAPTNADHVGGRIALVGANVTNDGTIFTPDGQTILAAGLQVGMTAHSSSDPSLRGLDVYVGAVSDPDGIVGTYAGSAGKVTNSGIISSPRGNITLTGKDIHQLGALTSSTSVALNGRIDINASYDAVGNPNYDPTNAAFGAPFLYKSTGNITLGSNSVIQVLPELASTEKVVGTKLALDSQVNMRGKAIHFGRNSILYAPSADVTINSGVWNYVLTGTTPKSTFVLSGGQVYMDSGAWINVAGSTDIPAALAENILTLQLRGAEFSNSPFNRDGPLRGIDITLDIRRQGMFNGFAWVGTPLADASGFVGLIERTVGALTTAGGTVKINSGGSVIMQGGSGIDVSGGFINYAGGEVQTTRVTYRNHIYDIWEATPDRVYDGIYTGTFTTGSAKWGQSKTYTVPFMLGRHYEPGYTYGADGGSISINAPSMALDGQLRGHTINGPRQRELRATPSSLSLAFQAQRLQSPLYPAFSPTPPTVVFQSGIQQRAANPFALDGNGDPIALRDDRVKKVVLSPDLLTKGGFGNLTVDNKDGNIIVAAGESLITQPQGSVTLNGANVRVEGDIISPGGLISLSAYNISPSAAEEIKQSQDPITPDPNPGRGIVTLGSGATLDTSGLLIDDRLSNPGALKDPLVLDGGIVDIHAYSVNLSEGSVIDVSGGARIDSFGERFYGDAGSIAIISGQDLSLPSVLDGSLTLGAELRGFAGMGAVGGSLTIQAPLIQIGGSTRNSKVLLLDPDFFSQGGFGHFDLTGIGAATGPEQYTPGLVIAPGTVIEPVVQNYVAVPFGREGGMSLRTVTLPEGLRSPLTLNFGALGSVDDFTRLIRVRGDVVMGAGAVIKAGPLGTVNFHGDTVTILGSVFAPGGFIGIKGADKFPSLDPNPTAALATVYIGPSAHLSTAGTVVLTPDAYGRRTGYVLPGGTISVSGNIVAERGALLDVSGTSGELDLNPALLALTTTGDYLDGSIRVPYTSGLTTPVYGTAAVRTTIDSSGGTIILHGGEELFTRATLRGDAGGPTATGGTLIISSGRFYPSGTKAEPDDINLVVTQTQANGTFFGPGQSAIGKPITGSAGMGYFAADDFLRGGFDNLQLGGNVQFDGRVSIDARGALSVGTGGVIAANDAVNLSATYVSLGTLFAPPMLPTQIQNPFILDGQPFYFPPTFGPGSLTVRADHIDMGNLSLQNIGSARLVADNGDVRGNGTFNIAGDLYIRAAQIYPVTGTSFTIAAYDHGGIQGSVTFERSGLKSLPMSAGGTLNVYSSNIYQNGVLRAPFGIINLGWDGTGTAPQNLIVGNTLTLPTTRTLTLGPGSITSVSAIDPITGRGVLIPYGTSPNGTSWIDPAGNDITSTGLPAKAINLSASSIDTQAGSVIDIRGGGDLYAYRFVSGVNGTIDILANEGAFAVIPGYSSMVSPFAAFNTDSTATNLNGDLGYVNSTLRPGDRIYLDSGSGLRAGVYTLLPARYALLPGAFLITPQSGNPIGTFVKPDGATLVNGYRFNSLNGSRDLPGIYGRFEIANKTTIATRAQYDSFFANDFLTTYAIEHNQEVQRLPQDSGQLVLAATTAMALNGSVLSRPVGPGRGGLIDISSPVDIIIGHAGTPGSPGKLVLDSAQLSKFGAESLLVGGVRTFGADGTYITVKTNNITVSNLDPFTGQPEVLSGPEIILVANRNLTVDAGSAIRQTGSLSGPAATLLLGNANVAGSGDGTLLRVSSDPTAEILRSGVSSTGTTANMIIGSGASISGNSVTLDSTYATNLNPFAAIDGRSVSLNSGQVSVQLNNPGVRQPTVGLVLTSSTLGSLQSATSLSLLSYTTIDIYGTGQLGSDQLRNLSLHAGEIRGFNTGGGTANLRAQNITLDNSANGRVLGPVTPTLTGTLSLDAATINISKNALRISQYANLNLNAPGGLFVEGSGSLQMAGSITANTPFIYAARSATQAITAGGALNLVSSGSSAVQAGGLGASLALQGASVNLTSGISLPSGILSVNATSGDLVVGGLLSVAGLEQDFYDVARYTNGGSITLGSRNGNVRVNAGSMIDVSAPAAGASAGTLTVNAPTGTFTLNGTLDGTGGASFALDVGSLASTSGTTTTLNNAGFSGARNFRVRTGNVLIDGTSTSEMFSLSADLGSINVTGTIDVSGVTGGTINLMAAQGVTLQSGSRLDASADTFDSAGKGGAVSIETRGIGGGQVSIATGSTIDLSVAEVASLGEFSGTLHLRAPQNGAATNLNIAPINGSILGASSIVAEGYKTYDLTGTGTITTTVQNQVLANGMTFGANDVAITNALLSGANAGLQNVFSLQVGAEIINSTGNLTLGSTNPGGSSAAWNLANFRFGSKQAPGVLTLRAKGNLVFNEALSDGFTNGTYTSELLPNNALLGDNAESWSYRLVAGADMTAADFRQVVNGTGSLLLGRNAGDANESATNIGANARTSLAVNGFFQVIRTGSGSIDIATGQDVQLLNQFATIYTAGTQVADPTLGGTFDTPILDFTGGAPNLGGAQQNPAYPVQYSLGGGNVTINAGNDIIHLTRNAANQLVADSERQLPVNWLYRRGYVDPATGAFGTAKFGDTATTTWWVDFSNFFEGFGALGGGNVSMTAGRDIANVDAAIPTNARTPKTPSAGLVELGGGDLTLRTGRNLDAGVYYVERGRGSINAGGSIITNATRSPSLTNLADAAPFSEQTWMPTTLFVGKSFFEVEARGDLLLGPASNPFLLPGGYSNSFWYKTYFNTYSADAGVEARSLSGDVTLRESITLPTIGIGGTTPILQAWLQNVLLFDAQNTSNASYYHPWLRLNESKVSPFTTVAGIMPGTLKVTAFSGDINLAGNITLAPSPTGTLDLLAAGAVNGLQIIGTTTINGQPVNAWASSDINVSDASPGALPGINTPFAFQTVGGLVPNVASKTGDLFLAFIDTSFRESGSTAGTYGVLQTKQALHAQGILHANDATPLRIYADGGDIAGLTLFSPKAARIVAEQDIRDIAFYIQNTSTEDVSVVSSGRDMILYDANSPLRNVARSAGNALNFGEGTLAGDIQISGPGTLEVLAGRNLDLGTGGNNADGTGVGIVSIGNGRNPSLPFDGAHIIAAAGIGPSYDLSHSNLDFDAFLSSIGNGGAGGHDYYGELEAAFGITGVSNEAALKNLSEEEQKRVALALFYLVLRNAGRDSVTTGNYDAGFAAIDTLFGGGGWEGDITTQARDIRTKSGGNINLIAPGGGLQLATSVIGQPLAPPGIITEGGGSISIFTDTDVDIGISRIFTLRGGDEIIWASNGNIAAGSSSKTVQSAPPTRVIIDPQSGDVTTDLAGLATGGGIGVLATVSNIPPGSVDLIAPNGTIDAGDAGIRATGNLNIAAVSVLNASNISVGGTTAGAPAAPAVSAPNVGGLTSSSNAAAAGTQAMPKQQSPATNAAQSTNAEETALSLMTVEVIGYGGGEGSGSEEGEDEEEKKKRAKGDVR